MEYQHPIRLLSSYAREDQVYDALWQDGYRTDIQISRHIRVMFDDSVWLVKRVGDTRNDHQHRHLWEVIPRIRRIVGWAEAIPLTVFFEFFTALIVARSLAEREEAPDAVPNDNQEQNRLLRAISDFRNKVGDHDDDEWITHDADIHDWVGHGLKGDVVDFDRPYGPTTNRDDEVDDHVEDDQMDVDQDGCEQIEDDHEQARKNNEEKKGPDNDEDGAPIRRSRRLLERNSQ